MNSKDRIAALASIANRVVNIGDRLARKRVAVELLTELAAIKRALDDVREDIESEEEQPKS